VNRLESLLRFIWEFVIGDDWRIALGVVLAISATALIADTGIAAWWILPVAVGALLWYSVRRAARTSR
jgi:hypothetical protein